MNPAPDSTRPAVEADIPALAKIWHQGWMEAHKVHVPADLTRQRSKESFLIRMAGMLTQVVTIGPVGRPLGFCAVKGSELYQIYVAPSARGTGVARLLLEAGEERLRAAGVQEATVEAVRENARAIAFYQKNGWSDGRLENVELDTLDGSFALDCLVLRKSLQAKQPSGN